MGRYKALILEKDLIFYKIYEDKKEIIIYAVVDQRQDYLNIIQGLFWLEDSLEVADTILARLLQKILAIGVLVYCSYQYNVV